MYRGWKYTWSVGMYRGWKCTWAGGEGGGGQVEYAREARHARLAGTDVAHVHRQERDAAVARHAWTFREVRDNIQQRAPVDRGVCGKAREPQQISR
jgi:hypothetical protein